MILSQSFYKINKICYLSLYANRCELQRQVSFSDANMFAWWTQFILIVTQTRATSVVPGNEILFYSFWLSNAITISPCFTANILATFFRFSRNLGVKNVHSVGLHLSREANARFIFYDALVVLFFVKTIW